MISAIEALFYLFSCSFDMLLYLLFTKTYNKNMTYKYNKVLIVVFVFIFATIETILSKYLDPGILIFFKVSFYFLLSFVYISDKYFDIFKITIMFVFSLFISEVFSIIVYNLINSAFLHISDLREVIIFGNVSQLIALTISRTTFVIIFIINKKNTIRYIFMNPVYLKSIKKFYLVFFILLLVYIIVLIGYIIPNNLEFVFILSFVIFMVLTAILFISGYIVSRFYENRILSERKDFELDILKKTLDYEVHKMEIDKKMMHDFKNFIIVGSNLLKEKKYKQLEEYFERNSNLMTTSTKIDIGLSTLNILLSQKIYQAENFNIRFNVSGFISNNELSEHELDISFLLGNIIDNAIDAVRVEEVKNRWIDLKIKYNNEILLIESKNFSNISPIIKQNKYLSSKREYKYFGNGIEIIKEIARKYNGSTEFRFSDKTFYCSVCLNIQ